MYSISQELLGTLKCEKLHNVITGESVTIIPNFGASINGLWLSHGLQLVKIIDGYTNESNLNETAASSFKGAFLFPYPNRVNKGAFVHEEILYQLPQNETERGHALHGLLWNKPFMVLHSLSDLDKAELTLSYIQSEVEASFPFTFEICIVVSLSAKGLKINTTVTNTSKNAMPYGVGWHPYICINDISIDDLHIELPKGESLSFNECMIPDGNLKNELPQKLTSINDLTLDDCIVLDTTNTLISTTLSDYTENIAINLWQKTGEIGYNYLQAYTPPQRKSIAIEPQTCAPDALNTKKGLMYLEPEKSSTFEWGIFIDSIKFSSESA